MLVKSKKGGTAEQARENEAVMAGHPSQLSSERQRDQERPILRYDASRICQEWSTTLSTRRSVDVSE